VATILWQTTTVDIPGQLAATGGLRPVCTEEPVHMLVRRTTPSGRIGLVAVHPNQSPVSAPAEHTYARAVGLGGGVDEEH